MSVRLPASTAAPASTPAARRGSDPAFGVYAAATAVGLLHAVDDAVLHRQAGVSSTQHLAALAVVSVLAAATIVAFRHGRTGVRAALCLGVGAVTLTNGAMHVIHVGHGDISGSDATGLLAAVAGAVLVAMAVVLPFRHRGERGLPPARRWALRGTVTASTAAVVVFGLLPIGVGIGQTHMARRPIGGPPDGFMAVDFRSSDGLQLSGWYTATSNGAALVIVSGARGDRLGALRHAELLADHGYGVLVYDARGAGRSEGSPNGYGWGWKHDVTGALDFLSRQPGVEPTRLGGLGISTGADVLIEAAASDRRLAAVVSDGATIRSGADIPPGERASSLVMWPVLATVRLLSGETPGPPLVTLAARVSPTPLLLIACGSIPSEITVNRIYAEAAREPVELWVLPHVAHTAAIREEAADYERRVVAHFDQALLK